MIHIEIVPINYYSCQVCQGTIKTVKELMVERGVSPLCSKRCLFMQYYKILGGYSKEWLVYCAEALFVPKINELNEQMLLFEVCKKYPKTTLTSINKEVTGKVTDLVTTNVTKQVTGYNKSPYYEVVRDCNLSCNQNFETNKESCNQECNQK